VAAGFPSSDYHCSHMMWANVETSGSKRLTIFLIIPFSLRELTVDAVGRVYGV
jgi:hypothetical protein